jgi:hypothetical protein
MCTVSHVQSIVEFSIMSFHGRIPSAAAFLEKKKLGLVYFKALRGSQNNSL